MPERLGRILDHNGLPRFVRAEDEFVQPLSGNIFGEYWEVGDKIPVSEVRILPPLLPSKVVGIGSNYKKHIAEMGRQTPTVPKMFLKPNTSVIGNMDAIAIPPTTTRVDHEVELGVVISRFCQRVRPQEALSYILGFTCVNDVTARDFQREDGVFARGKGFDTFCPIGPWILKTQEIKARQIRCWVDDELRQDGSTDDLLFGVAELVGFVSNVMTLLPGDVIATGTPSGVGPLRDGNLVTIEIEGIGRLQNPIVNREDRCSLV
jgi:2-keto-4-pentenoate hydratase/2-oxohepta-3-ene-1,7-dioic acid hydratase in catechol pathway